MTDMYNETIAEAKELIKKNRKLKQFYDKQCNHGWNDEEALLNTYDEWFYHRDQYERRW